MDCGLKEFTQRREIGAAGDDVSIAKLLAGASCQSQVHPKGLTVHSSLFKEATAPKPLQAEFPEALIKRVATFFPEVMSMLKMVLAI